MVNAGRAVFSIKRGTGSVRLGDAYTRERGQAAPYRRRAGLRTGVWMSRA